MVTASLRFWLDPRVWWLPVAVASLLLSTSLSSIIPATAAFFFENIFCAIGLAIHTFLGKEGSVVGVLTLAVLSHFVQSDVNFSTGSSFTTANWQNIFAAAAHNLALSGSFWSNMSKTALISSSLKFGTPEHRPAGDVVCLRIVVPEYHLYQGSQKIKLAVLYF